MAEPNPGARETLLTCDGCGASIYPQHLERGQAQRMAGKVFCVACVAERQGGGEHAPAAPAAGAGSEASAVRTPVVHQPKHTYRRAVQPQMDTATRCRTFHCRLSDAGFSHLNAQIDEWVDAHDDVQIKFATSSVGTIEGKHTESHLIVTVFY